MKASTVFAFNRGGIEERLAAGVMVSEVYRELTAFLKAAGHKKIPHQQSLYHWIKKHVGKAPARTGDTQQPAAGDIQKSAAPSPSAEKGKRKVFDPHRQYDVDELI